MKTYAAIITILVSKLHHAVAQASPPDTKVTLGKLLRIYHCPFDVKATMAPDDTAAVDLVYTAGKTQDSLFVQDAFACFVQFELNFQGNATASVEQVEYKGDFNNDKGSGEVGTMLAWTRTFSLSTGSWGPVRICSTLITPIRTKGQKEKEKVIF